HDRFGEWSNASLDLLIQPAVAQTLAIAAFWATPTALEVGNVTVLDLVAVGGVMPLHYDYAGLPPGCSSSNITPLPCAPTGVGTWTITGTVTDAAGHSETASLELVVTGRPLPAPPLLRIVMFQVTPSPAVVGEVATWVTILSGGVAPFSYAYSGLPETCIPLDASTFPCTLFFEQNLTVQVVVHDSAGQVANATTTLAIGPMPRPVSPANAQLDWPWVVIGLVATGCVGAGVGVLIGRRDRRRPPV
ncbi:MAG TPA: hypothetical protein VEY07_06470, partial [Thermoplasmata archaeon]|nr:hypothetical protein [Thermoplasmata archaeon]